MTDTLVEKAAALSSHIPLNQIFIGKRRRKDYGDMEDLKKDLQENGQITAITVCPPTDEDRDDPNYKGEPWSLVAGGRRLRAATELMWPSIRAIDRESMDELTRRVLELAENLKRKDMSFLEIAAAKQEMFLIRREQNPEITQAEVAKEIGETPANFSRDLKVAEVVQERPELKGASSKKAILRQAKMADHFEARAIRDEVLGQNYMMDLKQRLVTMDARDWLRTLPNGFADLCIPDLPYGIDHFKQGHKTGNSEAPGISEYDDSEGVSKDLFTDMVPQMIRVTKSVGWVVCFMSETNYEFLKVLFENCCLTHHEYRQSVDPKDPESPFDPDKGCKHGTAESPCVFGNVEEPRWYWFRPNSQNNPRYPELHAKNVIECILVFNRGGGRLMRPCDNVLMYDAEYGTRIHAMQKPLEMLKDLISRFTLPGETVIDPCFGSGAHLAAGAALARNIHGCDSNPALLGPALGYVSLLYQGVAPVQQAGSVDSFLDARAHDPEVEGEDTGDAFDPGDFPDLDDSDEIEELDFSHE